MRLIDADNLKNIIESSARFSDFLGRQLNDDKTAEIFRSVMDGVIKQIDAEPTVEAEPVVYCWKCKHWDRNDKVFCDFDGKEWHGCKMLDCFLSASGEPPMTPGYFYCGDGEKIE